MQWAIETRTKQTTKQYCGSAIIHYNSRRNWKFSVLNHGLVACVDEILERAKTSSSLISLLQTFQSTMFILIPFTMG